MPEDPYPVRIVAHDEHSTLLVLLDDDFRRAYIPSPKPRTRVTARPGNAALVKACDGSGQRVFVIGGGASTAKCGVCDRHVAVTSSHDGIHQIVEHHA